MIFLLPPSEGKNSGGDRALGGGLTFDFQQPLDIAINATEKDLKCTGKRYLEAVLLHQNIEHTKEFLPAIERYSGVMYSAIDFQNMSDSAQSYFEKYFYILSGMYGVLRAGDQIGNYKLPIETQGLYKFWGEAITDTLNNQEGEYIIDLLPGAYKKMIQWEKLTKNIIRVDFYDTQGKKYTHGVKKVKGEYINNLCHKNLEKIEDLGGKIVQISANEYHIGIVV